MAIKLFYVPSIPSPRVKVLAIIQCWQCGIIHKAFKLYFTVLECHQNFLIELQSRIQWGVPFSALKLLTSPPQYLQGLHRSSKGSSTLHNPPKTSPGTLKSQEVEMLLRLIWLKIKTNS